MKFGGIEDLEKPTAVFCFCYEPLLSLLNYVDLSQSSFHLNSPICGHDGDWVYTLEKNVPNSRRIRNVLVPDSFGFVVYTHKRTNLK